MTTSKAAPSHKGKKNENDDLGEVNSDQNKVDPTPQDPVTQKPPGHHDDPPRRHKV